jgi:hypothetical protein
MEFLKVIKVQWEEPLRYFGYIVYKRIFEKGYDYRSGDLFDQLFIEAIQKYYPQSNFIVNQPLLQPNQLQNTLQTHQYASAKELQQFVWPKVEPIQKAKDMDLSMYTLKYSIKLSFSEKNALYDSVLGFDAINLDYTLLPDILSTIEFM